jgi:hypothetical protein
LPNEIATYSVATRTTGKEQTASSDDASRLDNGALEQAEVGGNWRMVGSQNEVTATTPLRSPHTLRSVRFQQANGIAQTLALN